MTITTLPGATSSDQTTLQGTDGADSFTIESNDVYVHGLQGKDTVTINSSIQNITINAGTNDDILDFSAEVLISSLILGLGSDRVNIQDFSGSIYGGSGLDRITVESKRTVANTLIRGDSGNDVLELVNLDNTIINTNADDDSIDITGTTMNSSIYGGRQNDVINIGKTLDSLIRGDANDDRIIITGDLSNTLINGNAGDDTLLLRATNVTASTVFGGQGNDVIDSNGDSIYIDGGKGNDDIDTTGDKKHTIYGGDGEDSINSNSTKELFVDGGSMKDIITLTGISNTVHSIDGGAGGDIITATTGKELIDGGTEDDGNDTIDSAGGDDTIYGRAGNDLIQLTADGTIRVQAGAGDDTIEVRIDHLSHVDTIQGEKGTDTIAIVGNASNYNMWETNTIPEKAFDGISKIEVLAFGTEDTTYSISGTKEINLSSKVQSAGVSTIDMSKSSGFGDDVLEINAFQFSAKSNLTFIGSDDKDVNVNFTGGSGNDTITTGKIAEDAGDTLTGGLGEDTFNIIATTVDTEITDLGAGGDDVLIIFNVAKGVNAAVTGNYTASPSTANHKSTADVVLNAGDDIDIDMSSASGSFGYVINGGTSSSNLQGSNFNDSITGNAKSDVLTGGEGADTIVGGAGADIVNLDESTPAADHFRAEGSSNGADNTDVDNIINGFTAANDVFDFADATGAYNGTAARTGYAEGGLGNIGTAVGMQIFSDNIIVSGNAPNEAEMQTYFADGGNDHEVFFVANADSGVYVAADDGIDTYIMHLASGGAGNKLFTSAEDTGTVVAKLNGLADATSLSETNFIDFSA